MSLVTHDVILNNHVRSVTHHMLEFHHLFVDMLILVRCRATQCGLRIREEVPQSVCFAAGPAYSANDTK